MPIGVLIGSLLGLGALARGSELTVMRAAGLSVWRIAGSVAMAGTLLIFVAVLCGEFLAPPLQSMAKQQKLLSKFSTITFAGRSGPWVRDGNLLIHVSQQSAAGEFAGMVIFELDDDHVLKSVASASTASVQPDGNWKLSHYASTKFGGERIESEMQDSRDFSSSVGGDFLALTVSQPRQLETRVLWGLIRHLKENALDSSEQEFAFWSRIARTSAILVRGAARRAFRIRQFARRGFGRTHAAGRADRRVVFPRPAPDGEWRRGVRRQSVRARMDAHGTAGGRGHRLHRADALARRGSKPAGDGPHGLRAPSFPAVPRRA